MVLEGRDIPGRDQNRDLPEKLLNKEFNRDESFQYYVDSERETVRKDSEWLARLSVLAYGAHLFRRGQGGNLFAEAMHYAGRGVQYLAKISGSKQPLFARDTGPLLAKAVGLPKDGGGREAILRGSGAKVGEFSLIQDLAEAIGFQYNPRNASNTVALTKQYAAHFRNLPRTGQGGVFESGLKPVTVGDMLNDQATFFKVVNKTVTPTRTAAGKTVPLEIGILEHGKKLGLITDETIFDPKLLKSVKKGADGSKITKLLDTRMRSPFFALDTLRKSFDPFGQVSVLSSFFKTGRQVGVLGAQKPSSPLQIHIGGDIFESVSGGLKHITTGQTLGIAGTARHLPALLRDTQLAGINPATGKSFLEELYKTPPPKNWFERLQDKVGVGPKFHEQRGGFIQRAVGALFQAKGVGSGKAHFVAMEYKIGGRGATQGLAMAFPEMADEMLSAVGGQLQKGKFAKLITPENRGVLSAKEVANLSGADRLRAFMGVSDDLRIIKTESLGKAEFTKEDLYLKFGRAGIPSTQKTVRIKDLKVEPSTNVTLMGKKDKIERATFFSTTDSRVDAVYDFANYMTMRLNKLMSASLLGIGFRPSGNLLANTARMAAIPATYMAGFEALRYGNFAIGEITGTSPVEAAADLYTSARVTQQKFREVPGTGAIAGGIFGAVLGKKLGGLGAVTGAVAGGLLGMAGPGASVASSTSFVEEALLPGVDVGAVGAIGSGIAGYGALQQTGSYGKALAVAGSLYTLLGGPNVSQKSEELERVYAGEEKVPIRKARFWMLGYQPFKGGQISHYAPSWYTKLKQSPAAVNIYGSEEGYWKYGSMLPTPHNLFGLRTIADPYKLERANYYNRPYPVTGGLLEEVPVFGPLLSDTVGSLIKPRKKMHAEEQAHLIAASNVRTKGVPANVASQLGLPNIPKSLVDIDRPDVLEDRLKKYANVALEPTGIWKFTLELFGLNMDTGYKLASADNMSSITRSFYEASLGGAFGETEMIRRFLISDYGLPSKMNTQVNPAANTMPRWLPGSLSELEPDRDYFYDFTRGDPYTKIPGGEYRLPGPGYEAVNKLHSGTEGVYDAVDKFLVLSDVAPFSAGYHKVESEVNRMNLSPYWQRKVEQAQRYRTEKMDVYDFYEPEKDASEYYSKLTEINKSANLGKPATKVIRNIWSTVAQEGLSEIPVVGSKFFPYRSPVEHYKKHQVYGDTFSDWQRPIETIIRPAFFDMAAEDPLSASMKGAMLGALAAGAGPLASFKFLNPIQGMVQNEIATVAAGAALGAGVSTARMLGTGNIEGGFIPPHIQIEREVDDYFDQLQYAKYRSLQEDAEMKSNDFLAKRFASEARRTKVFGLASYSAGGDMQQYSRTLSRSDRTYFESFLNVSTSKQGEVLGLVPEHMRQVLQDVYEGGNANSNKSVMAYQAADEQNAKYFRDHALPDENWIGWHPSVPDTAIRIKSIQGGINGVSDNVHRFGFYPNQERETNLRFPTISPDEMPLSINRVSAPGMKLWMKNMFRGERQDTSFDDVDHSRTESSSGPVLNRFNVDLQDRRQDQLMAFLQDIYR